MMQTGCCGSLSAASMTGHAVLAGHAQVGEHGVGRHVLHEARGLGGVLGDEASRSLSSNAARRPSRECSSRRRR
jgi:hypothetical protein